MTKPIHVAVTGAAGQIAYTLLFKIASGEMFGTHQPVFLRLIDIPLAMGGLKGVAMEIQDCAFPLVIGISLHDNPEEGFENIDHAVLVGAMPRQKGMERKDLLQKNGEIFVTQGQALSRFAKSDVKVLVVGNPANTNALIACRNAPNLSPANFSAMTMLDHKRANALLAAKMCINVDDIDGVVIWGNHSLTQVVDITRAHVMGVPVLSQVDSDWYRNEMMARVAKRGGEIIEVRGKSSAASAAQAAIDHVYAWEHGAEHQLSMAIMSDGSYGIAKGIFFSYPVICRHSAFHIVQGLEIAPFLQDLIKKTEEELLAEKADVEALLPKETANQMDQMPKLLNGSAYYGLGLPTKASDTPQFFGGIISN